MSAGNLSTMGPEASIGHGMIHNDHIAPPSPVSVTNDEVANVNTPKKVATTDLETPVKAGNDNGNNFIAGFVTPPPKRKRAAAAKESAKKAKIVEGDEGKGEVPVAKETKAGPYTFPESAEAFTEVEKTIIAWRKSNKTWAETTAEVERVTGTSISIPTVRKRYAKLVAIAATFTPTEEKALLQVIKAVDDENKEKIKEIKANKWSKVAEALNAGKADPYNKDILENRFDMMIRAGRATADGDWIVPEAGDVDAEAEVEAED